MPDDVVLTPEEIQKQLETLPGWEVRDNWLRRKYKTPGFAHTMMLVNTIGYLAEAAWHHPDLTVGYAEVTDSTHRSNRAQRCDRTTQSPATFKGRWQSAMDRDTIHQFPPIDTGNAAVSI